ncbi:hypothetical protein G7067_06870 [Leucobacter insecticola]|uniref:Uncharacterized protein n=1 Tax=Leucobacter insecticola TaxID=2714934 RepID=A0A6G8FI90_9MICO|nr:hypothetical protein [Leucobacter insecticola]QIM16206.1 hypothetical protein G7067_06870 [Leucobacter insecticola]
MQSTWESYEATDPGFDQVKEAISELKRIVREVGNLKVGRGRSFSPESWAVSFGDLGGLVDGMATYCDENAQIASDGWQLALDGYGDDVETARREQAGWDLVGDALQIVGGAVLTVVGLGLTPFTGGFSLGLTALGGTLLVGGINGAINHASIWQTGRELNLIGDAASGVAKWYDEGIGQAARDSGSPVLQFLGGAGAAVVDMAGGALQFNLVETDRALGALATDECGRTVC